MSALRLELDRSFPHVKMHMTRSRILFRLPRKQCIWCVDYVGSDTAAIVKYRVGF